jgi:hypothetical protein
VSEAPRFDARRDDGEPRGLDVLGTHDRSAGPERDALERVFADASGEQLRLTTQAHRLVGAALVLATAPSEEREPGATSHALAGLECLGTQGGGLTRSGPADGERTGVHGDSFDSVVLVKIRSGRAAEPGWSDPSVVPGRARSDGSAERAQEEPEIGAMNDADEAAVRGPGGASASCGIRGRLDQFDRGRRMPRRMPRVTPEWAERRSRADARVVGTLN